MNLTPRYREIDWPGMDLTVEGSGSTSSGQGVASIFEWCAHGFSMAIARNMFLHNAFRCTCCETT